MRRKTSERQLLLGAAALAAGAVCATANVASGQISYTGATYAQDFDTMPGSATGSPAYAPGAAGTVYALPSQPDRSNMLTGAYNPMPGWYFRGSMSTSAAQFQVDSIGTNATGAAFSDGFSGVNSIADRALGLASTMMNSYSGGVVFRNDTAQTLTTFTLGFRGEQYRKTLNGGSLNFSYRTSSSFTTADLTAAGTAASSLDFAHLHLGDPVMPAPLDGNAAANSVDVSDMISGFSWAPGQYLWLRWNRPLGTGPKLAIDDVSFNGYAGSDRFYTGAHGGIWSTAGNWSTIEGGGGAAGVPATADNVYVRGSVSKTVNHDVSYSGPFGVNQLVVDSSGGATVTVSHIAETMRAQAELIGVDGNGHYGHSGGTNAANHAVKLGVNVGGSGTYTLSGFGQLATPLLVVGAGGAGTFTQTGFSSVTSIFDGGYGAMNIAASVGATGVVNLNDGTFNADRIFVGGTESAAGGDGDLNVNGGNVTVDELQLWDNGSADVYLAGGTLNANIFDMHNPQRFHWSAGTLHTQGVTVGVGGNLPNTFLQSSQTLITDVGMLVGMPAGGGVFVQNGGTVNANHFEVGYGGVYTLNSGVLTVSGFQSFEEIGKHGNGTFTQNGGTHTHTAFDMTIGAADPVLGSGTYNLTGGTLATPSIVVNATGTFQYNGGTLASTKLTINGGHAAVGPSGERTLQLQSLAITGGGRLQMNDNDMIVDYDAGDPSPEFTLRDYVKAVYLGGTSGISYTVGAGDVTLAVAEKTEWGFTSFNGFAIDDTTIVGKYTYFGDANLDGRVTSDDYVAVDVGLGTGNSWVQGDFNFSGTVTSDDYVAIDVNLGKGTPTPLTWAELRSEMIALHTEMFGAEYLAKLAAVEANGFGAFVPEPGSFAAGLLGGAACWRRRGRRMTRAAGL